MKIRTCHSVKRANPLSHLQQPPWLASMVIPYYDRTSCQEHVKNDLKALKFVRNAEHSPNMSFWLVYLDKLYHQSCILPIWYHDLGLLPFNLRFCRKAEHFPNTSYVWKALWLQTCIIFGHFMILAFDLWTSHFQKILDIGLVIIFDFQKFMQYAFWWTCGHF